MTAALTQATAGAPAPGERARRAASALAQVRSRFTWPGAAHHVGELYDQVSTAAPHSPRG